jgi:hypothetical protein
MRRHFTLPIVAVQPEQMTLPLERPADLEETFRKVFRRLRVAHPIGNFRVEYRPFAGLRSTIQLRNSHVEAYVSDLLEQAPPLVLEALAEILLARIFHRRPSREARECYLAYVLRPAVRRRVDEARRQRGSKRLLPARGKCHNLEEIFHRLNQRLFRGQVQVPSLGWSLKRSRTVLGHYDSGHRTIIVSRVLDSPLVPRYLVEYLVYHEMLHIMYPIERQGHRRVLHSREFREAEKRFPKYEQARRKLKHFCA